MPVPYRHSLRNSRLLVTGGGFRHLFRCADLVAISRRHSTMIRLSSGPVLGCHGEALSKRHNMSCVYKMQLICKSISRTRANTESQHAGHGHSDGGHQNSYESIPLWVLSL